jgi:hypothetical protein
MIPEFIGFNKIPRLSRDCIITEKLDGTNGQILITDDGDIFAGSRSRWLTPTEDNHGFAKWVEGNKTELLTLGAGRHFGEWWGLGINRNYGLKEKRFSLFNVSRWPEGLPGCCSLVPIIYDGEFTTDICDWAIEELRRYGSFASPGFMNPEGIVVFHKPKGYMFKKTLTNDEKHKGEL